MEWGLVVGVAVACLGAGGAVTVLIQALTGRRGAAAETARTQAEARKIEVEANHVQVVGQIEIAKLAQAVADDLRGDLARVEDKLRCQETESATMRTEIAQLRRENESLRFRVSNLESENKALKERIRVLEQENAHLRKENECLKANGDQTDASDATA